jgi:hypothetical protein
VFLSHICLIQVAVGLDKKADVENRCHLLGWYLGCLLLLKKALSQISTQLLITQAQFTDVIFVDVFTSTQSSNLIQ